MDHKDDSAKGAPEQGEEQADLHLVEEAEVDSEQPASIEEQLAKWTEVAMRAQAEVENMRKRSAREVAQAREFGMEKFAREMLTVKDSLENGLENLDRGVEDSKKLQEGVELTAKLLEQIFEKFAIEEIAPQGQPFDPEKHQAMMTKEDDQYAPGTVVEVMQKGYALQGRLLRPALVNVAGKPSESD